MILKVIFYCAVILVSIVGYRYYQQPRQRLMVGEVAPVFKLQNAHGEWQSLADWQGQWVVLYFYPKDDTPGCTKEACHFRDDISQFKAFGAQVVGISVDDTSSHAQFAQKHSLPFPLLSDKDGAVSAAYGALSNFIVLKIAKRYTFIIDPQGKVAKIYTLVQPNQHALQVMADLKAMTHE